MQYFVYLCPCLRVGPFFLYDLFFIIIFIAINHVILLILLFYRDIFVKGS